MWVVLLRELDLLPDQFLNDICDSIDHYDNDTAALSLEEVLVQPAYTGEEDFDAVL